MSAVVPDTEYGAKQWAKAHPLLAALGGRVFFSMPGGGEPTYPLLTVALLFADADDVNGIEHVRLTFDVWATTKAQAAELRNGLVTALQRVAGVQLDAATHCYYVDNIVSVWQPDNDAKLARYVVDGTFHVRA